MWLLLLDALGLGKGPWVCMIYEGVWLYCPARSWVREGPTNLYDLRGHAALIVLDARGLGLGVTEALAPRTPPKGSLAVCLVCLWPAASAGSEPQHAVKRKFAQCSLQCACVCVCVCCMGAACNCAQVHKGHLRCSVLMCTQPLCFSAHCFIGAASP